MSNGSEAIPEHEPRGWDGNGWRHRMSPCELVPIPEHEPRPGGELIREPIPSGLCGVLGCVFLYGHRDVHSWARERRRILGRRR